MFKRNDDIRALKGDIPNWVVAERMGIHENTLYHWMRKSLSNAEKQQIADVIHVIKSEMEKQENHSNGHWYEKKQGK